MTYRFGPDYVRGQPVLDRLEDDHLTWCQGLSTTRPVWAREAEFRAGDSR